MFIMSAKKFPMPKRYTDESHCITKTTAGCIILLTGKKTKFNCSLSDPLEHLQNIYMQGLQLTRNPFKKANEEKSVKNNTSHIIEN
jgi:hypothetical protein